MPLLILTGTPCTGLTSLTSSLLPHLPPAQILSLQTLSLQRSKYTTQHDEKQLRQKFLAEVQRHLSTDRLVIVDATNGIKSLRYQMFCTAKEVGTTYCVIWKVGTAEEGWKRVLRRRKKTGTGGDGEGEDKENEKELNQDGEEEYTKQTYDEMIMRYEEPNPNVRWDKPLIILQQDQPPPIDEIKQYLYGEAKNMKPNQATVSRPITSEDHIKMLDDTTQSITYILDTAIKDGRSGLLHEPLSNTNLHLFRFISPVEVRRLRQQFITLNKMHTILNRGVVAANFVKYLNVYLVDS